MTILRKPAAAVLGVALLLAFGHLARTGSAQQPVPVQGVAVAPRAANPHMRGATPGSRRQFAAFQLTRDPRFAHAPRSAPPQFMPAVILTPAQMSMWGNSQYGDCVTAEEFAAKCVYPLWYSAAGKSLDMPESLAISWARQGGYLNGADLTPVMDSMASPGVSYNGVTYTDGPYTSVDFTNWTTLTSAIYQGPVKIGIAANQVESAVNTTNDANGWVATGFRRDNNEDHCVGLWGYGTMQQLATAMGVTLPSGVNGSSNGLLLYTWDSIGIIDFASMNAITGEAWLRTPTTPQTIPPNPVPVPPTPTPGTFTYALGAGAPAGAAIDPSTGIFTWAIPPTQAPGTVTVSFTASNGSGSALGSFSIVIAAAGAIVIAPIPVQSAGAGQTFTFGVGQYVSQGPAPVPAPPAPAPSTIPMPPLPAPNPAPLPSPQGGTVPPRKAA